MLKLSYRTWLKIVFLVLIIGTMMSSAFYAYFKTRADILRAVISIINRPIYVQQYSFIPYKGIKIKEIEVENVGRIYNFELTYNLFELLFHRSLLNVRIDSASIDADSLLSGFGKIEKRETPELGIQPDIMLFVPSIQIKKLRIQFKNREYETQKIRLSFLQKPFMLETRIVGELKKPYKVKFKTIFSQRYKTWSLGIVYLKTPFFETRGKISYTPGIYYQISLSDTRFKNWRLSSIQANLTGDFARGFEIKTLSVQGEEISLDFNGSIKNLRDIHNIVFKGVSSFSYKDSLFNRPLYVQGNLHAEGTGLNGYAKITLDRLDWGDLKKGKAFLRLNKQDIRFYVDTLNLSFPIMNIIFKGEIGKGGRGKISGNIRQPTKILSLFNSTLSRQKIEGEIQFSGLYENLMDSLIFVLRGYGKNLQWEELRFPELRFSIGMEKEEIMLEAQVDSAFYKDHFLGKLDGTITQKEKEFVYHIETSLYPFGSFTSDGEIVFNDSLLSLVDKQGKLKFKKKNELYEVYLNDIPLFGGNFEASALLNIKDSLFSLNTSFESMELAEIPLPVMQDISGLSKGTLFLKGKLGAPSGKLELEIEDFSHPSLSGAVSLSMEYRKGIQFEGDYRGGEDNSSKIKLFGNFPLVFSVYPLKFELTDDTFQIELAGRRIPFELLERYIPEYLNFDKGNMDFYTEISGIKKDYEIKGEVLVSQIKGFFIPTATPFSDATLHLMFEGNKFSATAKGYSDNGTVRAKGEGAIEKGMIKDILLDFKVQDVPVYFEGVEATTSGDILFTLIDDIPYLEGALNVEKAYIVPSPFKTETPGGPVKFYYNFVLNGEKKIYLISDWIDAELKLQVEALKSDPLWTVYSGELYVINGKISYLGYVFEITEGNFFLSGSRSFNPEINLTAKTKYTHRINGETEDLTIYLNVGGTLQSPRFTLTSEPTAYSSNELLQMLSLGGVGTPDISKMGSQSVVFTEELLGGLLQKRMRISELSINPGLLRGGNPSFTLGGYITDQIYLKYRHDFLSLYKDEFTVKYFFANNFSVYSSRKRSERFTFGIEWEFRF